MRPWGGAKELLTDIGAWFNPFDQHVATLDIGDATIMGGDIDIIADAGRIEDFEEYALDFDATVAVDAAADTITFDAPHSFETGDAVIYNTDGGASIDGLTLGTTYYVIVVDFETIRLAETREAAEAAAPTWIAIDGAAATGIHTLAGKPAPGVPVLSDIVGLVVDTLGFMPTLPVDIAIAEATINLDNTRIIGENVNISATAITSAMVRSRYLPIWFGVGVSVATASVNRGNPVRRSRLQKSSPSVHWPTVR